MNQFAVATIKEIVSPAIDTALTAAMILLCEPALDHHLKLDESAQSTLRSIPLAERPGAPASGSFF
jgi:hypothetical protein